MSTLTMSAKRPPLGVVLLALLGGLSSVTSLATVATAQHLPVLIDGRFDDWEDRAPAYDGTSGAPTSGLDFGRVWIESSSEHLLIGFELDVEIVIQEAYSS